MRVMFLEFPVTFDRRILPPRAQGACPGRPALSGNVEMLWPKKNPRGLVGLWGDWPLLEMEGVVTLHHLYPLETGGLTTPHHLHPLELMPASPRMGIAVEEGAAPLVTGRLAPWVGDSGL